MEQIRFSLPPLHALGEVSTFYSYDGGSARSLALCHMAQQLAGRQQGATPVLMIDWDLAAPGLHHYFGCQGQRPGVLEYFQACRERLALPGSAAADPHALAQHVFDAIDWELYVERVDPSRPLYLMRAGLFDDSYGERADHMDWDSLFLACPALFRHFGEALARRFQHVLIDAASGRSAAVSICTTLLPRKLVGVFTPNQRSLEGLCGVVTRAIDYRCSHEDEQRPLLVYPLPALVDSADAARRLRWRRGDPAQAAPGYQAVLEQLLRSSYRMAALSLDSYFNEVQLQQAAVLASGEALAGAVERDADRFSLGRTFSTLLDWVEEGYFPWQSQAEVVLLKAVARARAQLQHEGASLLALPLARDLHGLGELYREQGREAQARDCFEESLALCERLLGQEHAHTLDARSALARTLSLQGEYGAANKLHEDVNQACERHFGAGHLRTLDALADQAATMASHHEPSRARNLLERVLEARERLLGTEHDATLQCAQQLALVLCQLGDLSHARNVQQGVVAARLRHAGPDHPRTVQAREALAEILADSGDLDAVREVQQALARSRERCLGAEHPDTLSIQLRLASTLGQQGDLDAARRLQQHVFELHERLHGADSQHTLLSKKMLAATLALQGHTLAARRLDEGAQGAGEKLAAPRAMAVGGGPDNMAARAAAGAKLDPRDLPGSAETLDQRLSQLQQLIDSRSDTEARRLADALRKSVLRPSVAHPTRRRGMAMIKEVYRLGGDTDALLALMQDEVSWLELALNEAAGGKTVAAPQ